MMAGSVQRDVPLDLFMPPKPGEGDRAGWQCLSSKLISFCKGRGSKGWYVRVDTANNPRSIVQRVAYSNRHKAGEVPPPPH